MVFVARWDTTSPPPLGVNATWGGVGQPTCRVRGQRPRRARQRAQPAGPAQPQPADRVAVVVEDVDDPVVDAHADRPQPAGGLHIPQHQTTAGDGQRRDRVVTGVDNHQPVTGPGDAGLRGQRRAAPAPAGGHHTGRAQPPVRPADGAELSEPTRQRPLAGFGPSGSPSTTASTYAATLAWPPWLRPGW